MTCWVRFPIFAINVWITIMASTNWVSKFNNVEEVPDSWDMLEKIGEVEHSWVKDKAVMKEQ